MSTSEGLRKSDMHPNPYTQFGLWFKDAEQAHPINPNAMTVVTATTDAIPYARTILLKGFDEQGFVFFTNYESPKALQLEANPRATLLFYWANLERQVNIMGIVEKVSDDESDVYYHSRPLLSRIGAWASKQSQEIPNREWLDERVAALNALYQEQDPPRPPHWGGYRVKPLRMEFWQQRPSRLHDRFKYTQLVDGTWQIVRLSP
ncbi:pyridoxamine 5'-phosphate oxidase [Beggiatoa leptomitoformis]|uniref:Pyridoxine/pyridoxamine 5'-phosphate oxidase n=1 Tax=Beggiatoa leptomitoformis TaxID=288004 RepID=A0A2N9YC08_9GAMM|nr:pyridoxamine 5'-phosphate oxidase [Beggiatoa leptomitoformis]ALG66656.1 pyridoxamine 5'-phosphate oxidase [Beggiatoa leptomitoformis]AUI68025.1 pyridoxamine 5'-phosphate oxidase [Beggiatoa leptomitoformis]